MKGANVFTEYWHRPDATEEAFTPDGWFKTGDVAAWSVSDNAYKILGRASVDILKSAGHKLSALEVERAILEHQAVAEVAVVGVPDETWGQVVAAVVRIRGDAEGGLSTDVLLSHCRELLPPEKVPRVVRFVEEIPKNAMGKVNKKGLVKDMFHNKET